MTSPQVGALLQDLAPQGLHTVFERLRSILHEGSIDKRVQFMIEGLFAVRKAGFEKSGHPAIPPGLDLVETEDQITHEVRLGSAGSRTVIYVGWGKLISCQASDHVCSDVGVPTAPPPSRTQYAQL